MPNKAVNWFLDPIKNILNIEDKSTTDEDFSEYFEDSEDITTRNLDQPNIYRPISWDQYIGQERAKQKLQAYIRGVKQRNKQLGHVIISGPAGTGKTTLAKIVAKELGVELTELITSSVDSFWRLELLIKKSAGQILFLDEVHAIERSMAERLYTIMEDFSYNGRPMSPFTLVGATTELGEIIEKSKPFYDRFKIVVELEPYTLSEMKRILRQYKNKIFQVDNVPDQWYNDVASNCRGVPRIGIRLLEACIYFGCSKSALLNHGIIKHGFTEKDLKALRYIANSETPVGLQSIASYLGTSMKNYLYEIEPYILQYGAIHRTARGRKISDKGIDLIKELLDA